MKIIKSFKLFENDYPEFEEDSNSNQEIDIPMELEYKLRTIESDSKMSIDDFFEECGVSPEHMTGFAFASILKQKEERFDNMSDDEFFKLYDEYKEKFK